jgi:hypothetical protein
MDRTNVIGIKLSPPFLLRKGVKGERLLKIRRYAIKTPKIMKYCRFLTFFNL